VAMVDVYPTVLREVGLPLSDDLVGLPLPRTPGEAHQDRIVFSETSRRAELRAAVSRRYKLIMTLPEKTYEFYDLELDPGERNNLASAGGPEYQRHREALDDWLREMAQGPRLDATVDLTDDEIRRLRSLGYADGGRK
jgi:arylsulfatase A-like enzyme